jgi:hemerythrin-like domain-containing protein
MGDGENYDRLIAWNRELTQVHDRLRQLLRIARDSTRSERDAARRELLLHCHGFCLALRGHHESEDTGLFPEISARHPQLGPVLDRLKQDHDLVASLLRELDHSLTRTDSAEQIARHLDGIAAFMESHFRYEERQLLSVLSTLRLTIEPERLLGPLSAE